MTNTTQNDLSLLRAFNLEAAKAGELLTDINCINSYKYLGFCNIDNKVVIQNEGKGENDFVYHTHPDFVCMKPLCWVENKPVYRGDVLWHNHVGEITVSADGGYSTPSVLAVGRGYTGFHIDYLTWNKPKQKVKRKVWINVYPDEVYGVHSSELFARFHAEQHHIIATAIETEIEYEV